MNQEKIYRISIQTDAAQQEVDATKKKLAELDTQLAGLDRNSDAAKALVTEMGKLAGQLDAAEGKVAGLNQELDSLKPGTIGALKQELKDLTAQLNQATEGTAEYNQILVKLGATKGEIRGLRDDINSLNPEKQITAFTNFASGVAGAFGICEVAAESFGLESSVADDFVKKTQSVIAVLSSLEGIRAALDNDTTASIKNTLKLAKSYITAGEGASTGSKLTKAALVSTGIGAIVILVGILIANWDRLTASVKGSEAFFTKVRAIASGLFDSAIASVKNFAGVIGKLFDGDFSGAIAKAKNIGKEVGAAYSKGYEESIFESHRKELEAQVEAATRRIEIAKAAGRNTFKQEEQNLLDKLRLQKQSTEDEKKQYLDLQKDLAVLRTANAKKEREDEQAAILARLDGKIALEQAKGNEAFQRQLDREKKQLAILEKAADPNAAAIIEQQNKIEALKAQHAAEVAEKKRAALVLAQQNELALEEKQGKDTLALRLAFAERLLAVDADGTEKARAQRNADYQALLLLEEEYNARVREGLLANQQQRQDIAEQSRETDKQFIDAAGDYLHEAYNKSLAKVPFDLGTTILTKLFGVKKEDVETVKQQIAEAYTAISQTLTSVATTLLSENIASLDSQLSAVQERISQLDQQAQAHNQAAQDAESQLAASSGARRTYLITKIEAERAAEVKLLAEKKKAAAEEAKLTKEKAQAEKEMQAVSLASTAAAAIEAAVRAIASAAAVPFPGNIPAILVAGATVGSAVLAARQLGKSLGDGGIIEGGSHASGNDIPVLGGRYRVEGGEAITPVDATIKNAAALELIRTRGRTRQLTPADFAEISNVRVLPHPTGQTFANGGTLPNRGSLPPGSVVVQQADLAELVATNRAMLAHLQSVDTSNQQIASFGPSRLAIGHQEIQKMREEEAAANQAEAWATLGGSALNQKK